MANVQSGAEEKGGFGYGEEVEEVELWHEESLNQLDLNSYRNKNTNEVQHTAQSVSLPPSCYLQPLGDTPW